MEILKRYFFMKGLSFALQIIFFFIYKGLKDKILHDMSTQLQIEQTSHFLLYENIEKILLHERVKTIFSKVFPPLSLKG